MILILIVSMPLIITFQYHWAMMLFTVLKAYLCADVAGCDNLKSDLIKLYTKIIVNSYHAKASSIVSKSKIISEDRSKAKKGKQTGINQLRWL